MCIFVLSSLATSLITPIWSVYIRSLGASTAELGYVFAASNAMACLLQVTSGFLSDRYGRRKLHVLGGLIAVMPPLLYSFATRWTDLVPWVVLGGLATGFYTPIRWAMVSDLSRAENRARAYSRANMATYAGIIVGPSFGGLMADSFGIRAPFILSSMLMGLCFPAVLWLRETRTEPRTQARTDGDTESSVFLGTMILFSAFYFIEGIGLGAFDPVTPVFVTTQFSVDLAFVGMLYTVGWGLPSLLLQFPGGWIADRYDKRKLVICAFLFASPFYTLFALSRCVWQLFIFMALSYGFMGFPWSAHQSLRMNLTPSSRWGLVNAIVYTAYWAGMTVGSGLSGVLYDNFGMLIPYCLSSVTMATSIIPVALLRNRPEHNRSQLAEGAR